MLTSGTRVCSDFRNERPAHGAVLLANPRPPVGCGHLPEAGVRQRAQRLAQAEAGLAVALPGQGQYRVRARLYRAVDSPGEVYAQEWELRVRHRGRSGPCTKSRRLRAYRKILAPEGDDPQAGFDAHHARHPIRVQAGAVDDAACRDLAPRGLDVRPVLRARLCPTPRRPSCSSPPLPA